MANLKHKLFLIIAKWIPVVTATGILINNTLAVMNICNNLLHVLDLIFGISISYIVTMYACSYAFDFCKWHRIVITYNLCTLVLIILIRYDIISKASNIEMLMYHYILAGIFGSIIYYLIKHKKINE